MTGKKSSESRRKLLKSIAAGSGAIVAGKTLPETWSRPVVDSVILPAHARTSFRTFFGPARISGITQLGTEDSMLAEVSNMLVPDAHAGLSLNDTNGTICGEEVGNAVDVTFQNDSDSVRRKGLLLIDGTMGSLVDTGENTDCSGPPRNARIIDITDSFLIIEFDHRNKGLIQYTVDAGTGCNLNALTDNCE